MGKKLDSVKNKSKEGKDSFGAGKELGNKAKDDTKAMAAIIKDLPTDVDDEILNAAHAVEQGTKSDAENYMRSEVNPKIEQGKRSMESSNNEANEQIKNNGEVKKMFQQMDSIGSFGKSARETGNNSIDQSTQQFQDMVAENEREAADAQRDYERNLSDISSSF